MDHHREFMNHCARVDVGDRLPHLRLGTSSASSAPPSGSGPGPGPGSGPGPGPGPGPPGPGPGPGPPPVPGGVPAANKILSRNINGTLAVTSIPSNESELQLYRVLQRANLLSYYDTLIEQGGDDVQQLCEAGEEEFLEIMALVGMASKPLHVRRLQKALQEWVSNPAMFQTPLVPNLPTGSFTLGVRPLAPAPPPPPPPPPGSSSGVVVSTAVGTPSHAGAIQGPPLHTSPARPSPPGPPLLGNSHPHGQPHGHGHGHSPSPSPGGGSGGAGGTGGTGTNPQSAPLPANNAPSPCHSQSGSDYANPGSPLQLTPVLVESQIQRLAEAAEHMVKTLPQFEPKPHNAKKKMCKELEVSEFVMNMSDDDPRRMEEIRKYAAIYGRFDCKRKPEKPLTLHEVSVNEAAAQICKHVPALLTRRDELFPLARQVVRDSGYQYSKGHSSLPVCFRVGGPSGGSGRGSGSGGEDGTPTIGAKRLRLDASDGHREALRIKRQERMEQITEELRQLVERYEELRGASTQMQDYSALHGLQEQMQTVQSKQTALLMEQSELMKQHHRSNRWKRSGRASSCSDPDRNDTDDTDSQFSLSNSSSPSQDVGDSREGQDSPRDNNDSTPTCNSLLGNGSTRSPNKLPKQLFQEALMDEGLRVVKEMVASQDHTSPDPYDPFFQEKLQVIASSGGNIIAVANPALSMSTALHTTTTTTPSGGNSIHDKGESPSTLGSLLREPHAPSAALSPPALETAPAPLIKEEFPSPSGKAE